MRVLLIEDNSGDIYIISNELKQIDPNLDLTVITNGQTAINYLVDVEQNPEAEVPELIILTLDISGILGLEILKKMQKLKRITPESVIVFTGNTAAEYEEEAFQLGVSGYFCKDDDFTINQERIRIIYQIARERL